MIVEQKHQGKSTVISLDGRFDAQTAPVVEKELLAVLEQESTSIIVDFEKVDYISSSGLRVLLGILKESKKKKINLYLVALKPSIQQIFQLSGFDTLFSIYSSLDQAVEEKL